MTPATNPNVASIHELREWLEPTEYLSPGNEYMKHLNSYVPGTGDWLRESETFNKWEDGMERGCLWVRGIPGSGKSVFAASTVKTLAETQDGEGRKSPVLFFFFRQIVEKNHDPKYLVRDWVAQLLPFSTNLQEEIDEFAKEGVDRIETTKLWDALVRAMDGIEKVFCVADALDEMDDQHASFIDKLKQLGARKPGSIKVMLTSRPIPRIENQLRHPTVESVKLEPARIYPDIVSYISTRLSSLEPKLSQEKEAQVKETICERSEGLFLYARLTMDSLTTGLQEGDIIEDTLPTSLAQLPRNLTEVYTRMLEEHSKRSSVTREQQFTILQCVTQSTRPMRLIELGSIIAFLTRDTSAGLKEGKEVVRQACGRFLEILDDESISVIHHSFTEFARDKSRSTGPGTFPVLDEQEAQGMMLQLCLQYLDSCKVPASAQLSVEVQIQPEEKGPDGDVKSKDEDNDGEPYESERFPFNSLSHRSSLEEKKHQDIQDLRSSYPFMAYATENLAYHIEKAGAGNDLGPLDSYFVPGKSAFDIWLLVRWDRYYRRHIQPLHIATYLGLTCYAQHLISTGSVIEARDIEGQTALMYAAEGGHVEIASLLLSRGANPDAIDRAGNNSLHIATQSRRPKIVRLLLAAGMTPKVKKTKCTPGLFSSDIGETPLQYACQQGNVEILTQFIEYLDVDDACRSLHWTVHSRKPDAVEAILKTGKAPIDALVNGLPALIIAADLIEPALIEVLLRHGANPNLRAEKHSWFREEPPEAEIKLKGGSEDGPTAMHALAGITGHHCLWGVKKRGAECMKLLVDAGGDVNARALGNHTPLHYAVKKRSPISMGDEWGWKSETTEDIITELLLQHGADPKVRCNAGATPLHKLSSGRPKIVDILAQHGADVNARDKSNSTPLLCILAAINDDWRSSPGTSIMETSEKTLLKLLEHGADVTAENEKGSTALHYMFASIDKFNNVSLWKAFIKAGADLNKPNKNGQPALLSIKIGYSEPNREYLLKALVDEGLQLNLADSPDSAVLFRLFDTHHVKWELFQALLNLGCPVRARDQNGATLLHHCIRQETDFGIFNSLVKAGADPIAVDNDGNSLLHEVALRHPSGNFASKLKTLVELGLCTDTQNMAGRTPLHIACATRTGDNRLYRHEREEEFLDLLLCGKLCPASKVNILDNLGATPIHYAASVSEYHVGRLLKAGADPTLKTDEGLTPLHIAARGRQSNVVCLLLSEYQRRGILQQIINSSDDSARTALHYACRSGRPESVTSLLSAGANFSFRDRLGRTPLHALAEFEEENLLWTSSHVGDLPKGFDAACVTLGDLGRPSKVLKFGDLDYIRTKDIIEMLEIAGADLKTTFLVGGEERSLMDLAVQTNCIEVVNELRHRGLSAQDKTAEALIPRPGGIKEAKALLGRVESSGRGGRQTTDDRRPSKRDHPKKFEDILQQSDYNLFNEFVKMGGDLRACEGEWRPSTGLHKLVGWGHTGLLEIYSEDAASVENEEWMLEEDNPGSLLCHACEQPLPRLEIIKVLVEKVKVDVNLISNRYGSLYKVSKATALHWLSSGAHFWNIEAMEYLLDQGADIERTNANGETPLMTAVGSENRNGFWKEETIRVLLNRGASPNVLRNDGNSCLNMADHANVTRMLLDHGADTKASNSSPLTSAITNRNMNVNMARLLLEAGSDPDECYALYDAARPHDRDGIMDPLLGERQREMITLLIRHGANPFAFFEDGFSVLQKSIEEHGILDLFWGLPNFPVELRGKGGRTPLISTCFPTITRAPRNWDCIAPKEKYECDPAAGFVLLERQANVKAIDDLGRTALHWMCTLPEALDDAHQSVFTALVDRSPDIIHLKDNEGFTPLQLAIASSHTHDLITSYLISCGSDPKEPDPMGNTVLHYLAPQLLGEKVKALVAADKFKSFLSLGLPIDHRNNLGETPLFLFISTSWAGTRDDTGNHRSPDYAIENDISHVKALHLFLEAGADLHTRNDQGETLLHITAERWQGRKSWERGADEEDMLEIFEDLMRRGLDPRAEDVKNRTAIDVAVACGNTFLVDLFGPKVEEIVVDDTENEEEDDDDD